MTVWKPRMRVRVKDWLLDGTILDVGRCSCHVELDDPGYHPKRTWIAFKDLEEI